MVIRFSFLLISVCLNACGKCDEDHYGDHLEIIVPFRTYPERDTFDLGDTIWFELNMDKDVVIYESDKTIRLDSFDFFTDFFISEISDTIEHYDTNIDTIVIEGSIGYLPLPTVVAYPVSFVEDTDSYRFKAGIVLKEKGLFWLGLTTGSFFYEQYIHPAVFKCNNERRERVDVYYHNSSTTQEAFEKLFLSTNVQYLKDLTDFEEYENVGSITIVVE